MQEIKVRCAFCNRIFDNVSEVLTQPGDSLFIRCTCGSREGSVLQVESE